MRSGRCLTDVWKPRLVKESSLLQIIWYNPALSTLAHLRYMRTGYISGAFLILLAAINVSRWVSYTSNMHGAIYIILKDSLKWIPVIGWGMQFYGFSTPSTTTPILTENSFHGT